MSNYISSITLSQFSDRLSLERLRTDIGSLSSSLGKLRPVQEFFDVRRISKPENFGEVQSRVAYNLGYFSSNYIAIVSLLSLYALITNRLLMFVIFFVVVSVFGISRLSGQDLVLPFGRYTQSQLYTALLIIAVPLGFFASPISTLMWLIGSSGVTVFAHASLMEKPIETVFEEEV